LADFNVLALVLLTSYYGADIRTTPPPTVGHKTVAMATLVA